MPRSNSISKLCWQGKVLELLVQNYQVGDSFTKKYWDEHYLPIIVKELNVKGKTPDQTLARVLQEIRDAGYILFLGNGVYKYIREPDLNEELRYKGEALCHRIIKKCKNVQKCNFQMGLDNMVYKGYLKFDFYITLKKPNFLRYKTIVVEFNGLQHLEPIQRFGGWEKFVEGSIRFNIKIRRCLEDHIMIVILEKNNYDHAKLAIELACSTTWEGKKDIDIPRFQKYCRKTNLIYIANVLINNWKSTIPTVSTFNLKPKEGPIAIFRLTDLLSDKINVELLIGIKELNKRIVFVERSNLVYTADKISYQNKVEKFLSRYNLDASVIIAWGDHKHKKENLFLSHLDILGKDRIYYVDGGEIWKDSSAPTIKWAKESKIKVRKA